MELLKRGGGEDRRLTLDLAAHLAMVSTPPSCGRGWQVQTAIAIAHGDALGGDFMTFSVQGDRLQAVVVDTSGKGYAAATRSLMLAGAISGLLGEIAATSLLPAINRHILRMNADEHFATATHLDMDLGTGDYTLGVAGHPAPVVFDAGSGKWNLLPATGPALGFLDDATWDRHHGRLDTGDALVIVTDGVVEVPGEDLDLGLDRLMGHADRLVLTNFTDGADTLLTSRPRPGTDDAQVLLIIRTR